MSPRAHEIPGLVTGRELQGTPPKLKIGPHEEPDRAPNLTSRDRRHACLVPRETACYSRIDRWQRTRVHSVFSVLRRTTHSRDEASLLALLARRWQSEASLGWTRQSTVGGPGFRNGCRSPSSYHFKRTRTPEAAGSVCAGRSSMADQRTSHVRPGNSPRGCVGEHAVASGPLPSG